MANAGDKRKRVCTVKSIDMNTQIKYANKDGTYEGAEIIYAQEYQGKQETKTKAFNSKSLAHPAQAGIKASLESLKKGDTFTLVEEFDGNYWNWKEVTKGGAVEESPAVSSPARAGQTYSDGSVKTLEIAGGRALNNAVVLLGAGATLEEVKEFAHKFYQMEQEFMAELKDGGAPKKVQEAVPSQVEQKKPVPAPQPDFDDDIPF